MSEIDFSATFKLLTGRAHFPWQAELFRLFRTGEFPPSCNLPTGIGKTSVIPIWLIALAARPDVVPRRLVYVVNRRTVVDQATREAESLRERLADTPTVKQQLQALCAAPTDTPLAISTLRGQFADNAEWRSDPARPAIIVGTVDMIGSRLLFNGYGIGFKTKPLHAGFLGQDVLLVHDEAHLEPAFQELLIAIQQEQQRFREFRRFRVMELSATSRGNEKPFELTQEERNPPDIVPDPPEKPTHVVWRRVKAKKHIQLHVKADGTKLGDQVAALALDKFKDSNCAVLVFLRKVDDVERVVDRLRKANQRVQQLTGTLRGLERDSTCDPRHERGCPVFARFLPSPKPDADEAERWRVEPKSGTVYLVCTSAGEVGVNISADHLVCDLSTFDSMAQRFGRVNRFGDRTDTEIHVVYPKEFDQNESHQRWEKTLALLQALNGDGSPKAIGELDPEARWAAFAPTPTILPCSDILFDAWALTTIRGKLPGRPPVEPYLHGISGGDPPETRVAWREEVWELRRNFQTDQERRELEGLAKDLIDDYPLKPHELLRDRSERVFKHLVAMADRQPDLPAWLLDDDGNVEVHTLRTLANKDREEQIYSRTVLLPPDAGGLTIDNGHSGGMLDGSAACKPDSRSLYDVADQWQGAAGSRRVRLWDNDETPDGMRLVRSVVLQTEDPDEQPTREWNWYERPAGGDTEGSKTNEKPVEWQSHAADVEKRIEQAAARLLPGDEWKGLRQALVLAAKFHDLGKKRVLWQRSIGNPTPTHWLAKSGGRLKPRELGETYRHEFGSLVDLLDTAQPHCNDLDALRNDDLRDVVLHLIAAHHGHARPHFPTDMVFDPEPKGTNLEPIAMAVPRRFARLQRRYGRWGLAYLESLLRAADYAASANPSDYAEDLS
ncbi:MAG: type I-U CRISPR-associated helicase/endonuclease Cas3 [Planctomycetes bacterium]|nr:type I-U CRISPR-associated helicase/endonuclease Cas3 [Planctomycetota bacterium]